MAEQVKQDMLEEAKRVFQTLSDRIMGKDLQELIRQSQQQNSSLDEIRDEVHDQPDRIIEGLKSVTGELSAEALSMRQAFFELTGELNQENENLTDMQKYMLEELQKLNASELMSKLETTQVLFDAVDILKKSDIKSEKIRKSLEHMDKLMGDQLIAQAEAENKKMNTGDSAKPDKVEDKKGGWLESILGFFTGAGGLASKIPFLGRILGLVKGLGKAFFIINGIIDFVTGFVNASEIIGKPDEEIKNSERILAGISNVISGLTLGLVDASDVYKVLEKGLTYLFGSDGVFPYVGQNFKDLEGLLSGENWTGFVDSFFESMKFLFDMENGFLPTIFRRVGAIFEAFSSGGLDEGIEALGTAFDDFFSLFSGDGFISRVTKILEKIFNMLPTTQLLNDMVDGAMTFFDTEGSLADKAKASGESMKNRGGMITGLMKGIDNVKSFAGKAGSWMDEGAEAYDKDSNGPMIKRKVEKVENKKIERSGHTNKASEAFNMSKENHDKRLKDIIVPAPQVQVTTPAPIVHVNNDKRSTHIDDPYTRHVNSTHSD